VKSKPRNKSARSRQQFLFGFLFNPEGGDDTLLQNTGKSSLFITLLKLKEVQEKFLFSL
jgi:hypothetical protein